MDTESRPDEARVPGGMNRVPVYTIGYGSRSADELAAALKVHAVGFVIDIRSVPYSRYKPEFSREALETFLRAQGFRYLYMGDQLGGKPADRDCYVDDKVVYGRLAQKAFYQEGIRRVRNAFDKQIPVALMCSEGKPEMCHRSKLIGQTLEEQGIAVRHIDENGELLTQQEVMLRLRDGQLSLFADDGNAFTSRKRYGARGRADDEAEGDDGES